MTRTLIQGRLLEGGGIESWRPERSRVASVEGFVAGGAGPQKPSGVRQPNDRQRYSVAYPNWRAVARRSREVWEVDDSLSALSPMERGRCLGSRRNDAHPGDGRQFPPQRGFDDGPRSCLCSRRKRGTREQAFGRSRGGFICKVHCLRDANGLPLAFHLTPGETADRTAFQDVMAFAEAQPDYRLADKG